MIHIIRTQYHVLGCALVKPGVRIWGLASRQRPPYRARRGSPLRQHLPTDPCRADCLRRPPIVGCWAAILIPSGGVGGNGGLSQFRTTSAGDDGSASEGETNKMSSYFPEHLALGLSV